MLDYPADGIRPIEERDIPQLAINADAESNPLYPVPKLMDVDQLADMFRVVGNLKYTMV